MSHVSNEEITDNVLAGLSTRITARVMEAWLEHNDRVLAKLRQSAPQIARMWSLAANEIPHMMPGSKLPDAFLPLLLEVESSREERVFRAYTQFDELKVNDDRALDDLRFDVLQPRPERLVVEIREIDQPAGNIRMSTLMVSQLFALGQYLIQTDDQWVETLPLLREAYQNHSQRGGSLYTLLLLILPRQLMTLTEYGHIDFRVWVSDDDRSLEEHFEISLQMPTVRYEMKIYSPRMRHSFLQYHNRYFAG